MMNRSFSQQGGLYIYGGLYLGGRGAKSLYILGIFEEKNTSSYSTCKIHNFQCIKVEVLCTKHLHTQEPKMYIYCACSQVPLSILQSYFQCYQDCLSSNIHVTCTNYSTYHPSNLSPVWSTDLSLSQLRPCSICISFLLIFQFPCHSINVLDI